LSAGGRGRKGVRPVSSFWKREGMPGNTHSLPSSRTTGFNGGCVDEGEREGNASQKDFYAPPKRLLR